MLQIKVQDPMPSFLILVAGIVCGLIMAIAPQSTYAEQPAVILVTGFEAFGGDATNGSWEAVQPLQGKRFGKITVVVAQLPVLWGAAEIKLRELVKANKPVAVIGFGQAGEEPVRLETTAHNVRENIPDNHGALPAALKIYPHAPPTLASGLPLQKIENHLRSARIPVKVSNDAGTYLCNDIFFSLMYAPGTDNAKTIPRGFVHVPPLDARVITDKGGTVIFDRKLLQDAAEIVIQTVVDTWAERKESGVSREY